MTQDVDLSVFRTLVPINGMKPESQKEIFAKVDTVLMDNGATLFKAGDQEPVSYYVVAGKVDLLTPDGEVMRTVKAETKESTYRLGHQFPRTCTARANGEITVVKFPNDLLDVALTWDQTGRFEVGELNDSDDDGSGDDWMTRVYGDNRTVRGNFPEDPAGESADAVHAHGVGVRQGGRSDRPPGR